MENQLTTLFLIFSLFIPRISLFVLWMQNMVPANPEPFWADVVLTIFFPRILVLILIALTLGFASGWFWLHLFFAIVAYFGAISRAVNNE